MPDFEIRILTKSELSGVNATQAALEKQRGRLLALGQDTSKVDAQLSRIGQLLAAQPKSTGFLGAAKEQAAGILSQIPGFERLAGVVTKLAAGPIAVIALGLGAVAAAFKTAAAAISEFAQKEEAVAELDQVLSNTGQLSDATREKFQALAGSWEETIGVADERMVKVLATLTKFGATSANIDQVTEATVNLAGAIGVDVETASVLMGRAMTGNFQMLSRYGFHVDRNATQTERLNQLMEQAAARGAGVLAAKMGTLNGHFVAFKTAVGNVLEGIGNFVSRTGVLQWALEKVTIALQWWSKLLPQTAQQLDGIKQKLPVAATAAAGFGDAMGDAAGGADAMGESLGKAADKATEAKSAFDSAVESIEALARAQSETLEAETALKLAQIELREKQEPAYTKEQAAVDKAKVRLGAEQKRQEIQAQAVEGKKEALQLQVFEGFSRVQGTKEETAEAESGRRELAQSLRLNPEDLTRDATRMLGRIEAELKDLAQRERIPQAARSYLPALPGRIGPVPKAPPALTVEDLSRRTTLEVQKKQLVEEVPKAEKAVSFARARESAAESDFGKLMDQLAPAWREIEMQQQVLPIQKRTLEVQRRAEVEAPTATMVASRAAEINVRALQEEGRNDAKEATVAIAQAFKQLGVEITDSLLTSVKSQFPRIKAALLEELEKQQPKPADRAPAATPGPQQSVLSPLGATAPAQPAGEPPGQPQPSIPLTAGDAGTAPGPVGGTDDAQMQAIKSTIQISARDTSAAVARLFERFGMQITDGLLDGVTAQLPKIQAAIESRMDEKLKGVRV